VAKAAVNKVKKGEDKKKKNRAIKELKEWGIALIYAIIFGTIIRLFVFETMLVPTPSMVPTIEIDDRLFVEKITYEFREPEYGEVGVFYCPFIDKSALEMYRAFDKFMDFFSPREFQSHAKYVKRVVGLPGDTIELRIAEEFSDDKANLRLLPVDEEARYQLYVNGELLEETEDIRYSKVGIFADPNFYEGLAHPDLQRDSMYYQFFLAYQNIINYHEYYDEVLDPLDLSKYIEQDPISKRVTITIPEEFYFYMGDNTTQSFDSRFFGFVPEKNIVGTPLLRIYPFDRFGPLNKE
jgi:signal peptidase I